MATETQAIPTSSTDRPSLQPSSRTNSDRDAFSEQPTFATGQVISPNSGRSSATPFSTGRDGKIGQVTFQAIPDGRVRTVIPNGLRNVDNKNGNFAVMHIDVNRSPMYARHEAAKRTSEGTEAAATEANKKGYQPVKRSKLIWDPSQASSQTTETFPSPPPPWAKAVTQQPPPLGLSPHDAKKEGERLLTFLRSLRPSVVVDRLCKAVSYFGDIPGDRPSGETGFPESESVNGSGSLLVSWLAEIFPHKERGPGQDDIFLPEDGEGAKDGAAGEGATDDILPVKRKRGRPKGSKGTKARKDKGTKKGPKKVDGADLAAAAASAGEAPVESNPPSQQRAPAAAPPPPASSAAVSGYLSQQPTPRQDERSHALPSSTSAQRRPTMTAADHQQQPDELSFAVTPTPKKRGRPKGSKNRVKSKPDQRQQEYPAEGASSTPMQLPNTQDEQLRRETAQMPSHRGSFTAANAQRPSAPLQQQQHQMPSATMQTSQSRSIDQSATSQSTQSNTVSIQKSRKRKAGQIPHGHEEAQPPSHPTTSSRPQVPQATMTIGLDQQRQPPSTVQNSSKRRRTSNDPMQRPGQQSAGLEVPSGKSASPAMHGSFSSEPRSISASSSFESPASSTTQVPGGGQTNPATWLQKQQQRQQKQQVQPVPQQHSQHQQRPQQQTPQGFPASRNPPRPQQQPQQSQQQQQQQKQRAVPSVAFSASQRPQQANNFGPSMAGVPGFKGYLPQGAGMLPRSDLQSNRGTSAASYEQQQQQQNMNRSSQAQHKTNMSRQGNPTSRAQQQQQQQSNPNNPVTSAVSSSTNQTITSTGQYLNNSFAGQNYMMNYRGSGGGNSGGSGSGQGTVPSRAQNAATASASFTGNPQMGGGASRITDPNIRERYLQNIGRR